MKFWILGPWAKLPTALVADKVTEKMFMVKHSSGFFHHRRDEAFTTEKAALAALLEKLQRCHNASRQTMNTYAAEVAHVQGVLNALPSD